VKVRTRWALWYDQYFGKLESASDDDDSDALVCEGWNEQNYISADRGYYPDLSRYQLYPESSYEETSRSDSYEEYCESVSGFEEKARLDRLHGDLSDDSSDSDDSVADCNPLKG
jgi:hypothetical protein